MDVGLAGRARAGLAVGGGRAVGLGEQDIACARLVRAAAEAAACRAIWVAVDGGAGAVVGGATVVVFLAERRCSAVA